jgi:hypothetical protein
MKLHNMQFSPVSCYFLSVLGPNIPLGILFSSTVDIQVREYLPSSWNDSDVVRKNHYFSLSIKILKCEDNCFIGQLVIDLWVNTVGK